MELRPDVILLGSVMRVFVGIQTARKIRALDRSVKIVMVNRIEDRKFVKAAVEACVQRYVFNRRIAIDFIAAVEDFISRGHVTTLEDSQF